MPSVLPPTPPWDGDGVVSLLPGDQTPEAGRKELLRSFAVTETQLREYRKLPVDEAKWRIEHEHRVQVEWAERRRAFLVAECLQPRPAVRRNTTNRVGNNGLEPIRSEATTNDLLPRTHTRSTQ
jgi:hypothetical protein